MAFYVDKRKITPHDLYELLGLVIVILMLVWLLGNLRSVELAQVHEHAVPADTTGN